MTGGLSNAGVVLVWGARGMIGRALVAELIRHGARVRVLTRSLDGPPPPWQHDVDWVALDGPDHTPVFMRALADVAVVFNLAGTSGAVGSNRDPVGSLESNCRAQLAFLDACDRSASTPHVVFTSSRLVYAPAGREPVTEAHLVAPRSMYGAHKLCVEHYHRIFAERGTMTFTVCRISNTYDVDGSPPQQGYGFISTLIQRGLAGRSITLFGGGLQLRDYLHVDDLAGMLRLCAVRPAAVNEVLNIGCGQSLSILEAATLIQQAFGGCAVECQPWPREYEAVESGDFVMDTTRARAILGYDTPASFADGLERIRTRLMERRADHW